MENVGELIDSQFLSESVGFLENCFENSFTVLQTSLKAVKEYLTEETQTELPLKKSTSIRKANQSIFYKSTLERNDKNKLNRTESGLENINVKHQKLKDWGLPEEIAMKYENRGVTKMFDWQVTCLSNPKVLMDCCNLVYSAPTSAGKTLVAEIITIKTILERHKKVIFIVPFVSIVREKMFYLQDILSCSGIRVEGFMGSQSPPGGLHAVHVAICTIEKANGLVNRLLDDGSISELGAIIVDELHLLGDPHRGYILELLLTKIKYISMKLEDTQIQIVGMSATLPNLKVLANWLEAELFITQFRPIPLDEYCLVGNKYYNKHGEYLKFIDETSATEDSDNILKICLDTIRENCSVLIFCMTKNRCENLAQNLSSSIFKIGCSGSDMGIVLRNQLDTDNISEMLEQLKNCPVGLDQVLRNTVSFGVAYHHAGLTFDERDIIEGGFKSGAIRILVATSTLSSGVNLPARKVIIRTPVFQRQPINILTYKQMAGRAGRMGKDTKGESILICTEAEKKIGFDLMMGALAPVKSCIQSEDKFMRAVLEMIASQIVCTESELELYSKCTLLFAEQESSMSDGILLSATLKELMNYELVRMQKNGEDTQYVATALGKACLSSSMAPNDGLSLFCELQKARQCLMLENDFHLIYLVTPYSVSNQWSEIDWLHLLTLWESLTKGMKKVGELVGVQESFIIRALRGGKKFDNSQQKLNIHKRFYTALALQDLVNEMPLSQVAAKFQCSRGFLQSLQQAAATFAGMVTAFCNQLGWKNMGMLVSQFQDRLHFGIQSDLIELMKLPSLNGVRARSLFDNGFETVSSIATGDVHRIENALYKSVPFQSEKLRDDDDNEDFRKRNKIKNVWITGNCAVTAKQAAEILIIEARKYLEYEIGISNIKWEKKNLVEFENNTCSSLSRTDVRKDACSLNCIEQVVGNTISTDNGLKITTENAVSLHSFSVSLASAHTKNHDIDDSNLRGQILDGSGDVNNKINNDNTFCDDVKCIENLNNKSGVTQDRNNTTDNFKNHGTPLKAIKKHVTKEDITWESLNFTEIPIGVTKNIKDSQMLNNQMFSPNISLDGVEERFEFKDFERASTLKLSSKDLSLFSSDGDNSSLFEDSLPLDLIPSKLLNNVDENVDKQTLKGNETMNPMDIILNEIDEDENIKLVYEDEKNSENKYDSGFNMSIDIDEINTQEVKDMSIKHCFVSPYKYYRDISNEDSSMQPPKKVKRNDSLTVNRTQKRMNIPNVKNSSSKKLTLSVNNIKFQCYVLKEKDIMDNINIFDQVDNVSVYIDVKDNLPCRLNTIGTNILKSAKLGASSTNEFGNNNTINIKSITMAYCPTLCVSLDLTSLDCRNIILFKNKFSALFKRKHLKWKYLSLQSLFVHFKRFLNIEIPLPWIDISLVEWLIDSDEKPPRLSCLVSE
ncbi:unnamed protein product [Diatraea saccharalis]|uniref:DNA polymerase theta n=1 Tax=Diatraea saccharalis TaxID=40085 RepID=A0A9P0C823_9NEOP|nr:unnamed protein product [Diatraea saccharalis]